jgi:hypothetical protein
MSSSIKPVVDDSSSDDDNSSDGYLSELTDLSHGDTIKYTNEIYIIGTVGYLCTTTITYIHNRVVRLADGYRLHPNQTIYMEGKLGAQLHSIRLHDGGEETGAENIIGALLHEGLDVGAVSDVNIIDDDDIEQDICGDIVSFLERDDVIGYDADRDEMKKYAEKLVNIEGCHSVEIIEMNCEDQDVDGWYWMKPMHRKAFKKWLLGTKPTKEH